MISPVNFPEVFMGYQGVDLSGGNIRMTQHGLNGSEVGPAFQQMGGKGMPQGVRRNLFQYSRLPAVLAQVSSRIPAGTSGLPGC